MMITVSLRVEEYRQLERLAKCRAFMDAETLLRCFACDLVGDRVETGWTGGSDERDRSHQWLDRRFGPESYARELAEEWGIQWEEY